MKTLADATAAIKKLRTDILFGPKDGDGDAVGDLVHERVAHLYIEALAFLEVAGCRMQQAMIENAKLGGVK